MFMTPYRQTVTVPAPDDVDLVGDLVVPMGAQGLVVFAHGSGSSRLSPRNRWVAERLREAGLATLLLDLLTPEEDTRDRSSARYRFDIDRLAARMIAATDWASRTPPLDTLPLGYFGASTGAAAALEAAVARPDVVRAVVSRGGRVDLAGDDIEAVHAPTLLVVGASDSAVLAINQSAMARLHGSCRLDIVPGATHLFDEPGALAIVARLAATWFAHHSSRQAPLIEEYTA